MAKSGYWPMRAAESLRCESLVKLMRALTNSRIICNQLTFSGISGAEIYFHRAMIQRNSYLHGLYLARMGRHFPGTWRVDGVTNIRDSCRHVDVRLSPLSQQHATNPYITKALSGAAGRPFKVHVSMIGHFIVGSVWEDGQRIFIPSFDKDSVEIKPEDALYTSLISGRQLPPTWPSELLCQSYFPLAPGNREALRSTLYAVVPVRNPETLQFLIVPCIELARFYFGVSSRMLTDLIRGRIKEKYANFDISPTTEEGVIQIHRKTLLSRPETLVIAQAMGSSTARSAMFGVHNTLTAQKLNNTPLEIDCKFPCSGLTRVTVRGKRLKVSTSDGKGSVWVLFAMNLETSNHRINACRIDLIDELMRAKASPPDSATYFPQDRAHFDEESPPPFNDQLDANQKLERDIDLLYSERFPALKDVYVSHPKEGSNGGATRHAATKGEEVDVIALTTAEGNYNKENKAHLGVSQFISENPEEASYVARDLDLFLETCSILETSLRDSGWRFSFEEINHKPFPDKRNYSRFEYESTLNWTATHGRARYLILCKMIASNNQHYYFLEMELKDSEVQKGQSTALMFRNDGEAILEEDWIDYLWAFSVIGGWPTRSRCHNPKLGMRGLAYLKKFLDTVTLRPIKHPHSTKAAGIEQNISLSMSTERRAYDPSAWAEKLNDHLQDAYKKRE